MYFGEYILYFQYQQISKSLQDKVTCKWNNIIHKQLLDKHLTMYIQKNSKNLEDVVQQKIVWST